MNENSQDDSVKRDYRGPWGHLIRGMWRTPLGVMGAAMVTISITLMVIGLGLDMLGLIENPYAAVATYMLLPGVMVTGLILIPLAAYLRRRQFHKYGIAKEHLSVNLSDHKHRKWLIGFIVLTVINVSILGIIGYEGYHFTESPYFCGVVCHQVMEPEFAVYQRSPHAKVKCVECHIGSGASWFVKSKISGLRQVLAVVSDSYSRPIPSPVEHLRPARDTCEECHWPSKFHGKKIKEFVHFTNDDQKNPTINAMALHIGGRNPKSNTFEGIHWHVSDNNKVTYLANKKRTKIIKVQVVRDDGSTDEFVSQENKTEPEEEYEWRLMDCIDCHNRPTHIYDMPEERVDFGLLSGKIDGDVPGIREDSLIAINHPYATRKEAEAGIPDHLMKLQKLRSEADAVRNAEAIKRAGDYLVATYLDNVWPEMNVIWGTYQKHLGHPNPDSEYGEIEYGCWRCHNEDHVNSQGKNISQECDICHDYE
ncbi:MAG: NapC/NirT family cytochrome c [Thermodesulfobacteriota bacterium]